MAIEIAKILHSFIDLLTWQLLALVAMIVYRKHIYRLLFSGKVKLKIAGIEVETTIPTLEASIAESLHGKPLSPKQREWLSKLRKVGRLNVSPDDIRELRPLRDAALLRAFPEGFLQSADAVEITNLGRMLVDALGGWLS